MVMKVFITGVAGLLGSNLAKHLRKKNIEVVGVDNLIGGIKSNIPSDIHYHSVDILSTDILKEFMWGCDVVIHCAALPYEGLSVFSPKITVESIVSGTVSVASAAISNNVKRFINFSSMARYGRGVPPFMETHKTNPVDPYGLAKVQAEQQLELLSTIHGLNYTTVVPHNVIGVGQRFNDPYRNVVGIMINRILSDKSIIVYGDGEQKRSFSDVSDCIDAVYKIMTSDRNLCGQVYNIGPDDNEISIKQLATKIANKANKDLKIDHFPDRPTEVKNAFCSSYKIKKDFNYNASVSLDTTLKNMIDWIEPILVPFDYHLPLEIINDNTPRTWKEQII
jgi:UDP-glucose 4-epimerase